MYPQAAETLTMNPEDLLFHDDIVPGLVPIAADVIDWLPAGSTFDGEDEDDHLAHFTESLDASSIEFADKHWNASHDSPFDLEEFDEFEDLDQIISSGSSSPINEFPFSATSSDCEESINAMKAGLKRSSKSSVSSSSVDDDDNDFKVKKVKGKKGSVTKPVSKQVRRTQDDATLKAINQLRAESGDHPDSRRRIHNVLERKRRNDLKFCYQELRESIPDLESTERTPTGTILARAAEYVRMLQEEEKKIEAGLAAARMENELLRRQLGLL